MQHHYLTREAIVTWLAIERGEDLSSETLITGAFTTDFFEESDRTFAARTELEALSEEELLAEYQRRLQFHNDRLARARDNIEAGLFFNKPGAFADYGFWARQLVWSIEECVALSLGRDPEVLSSERLFAEITSVQSSRLAREFFGRLRIARTWIRVGQLEEEGSPGELVAWLGRAKLSAPPELQQALEDIGAQIGDWKTLYDDAEENTIAVGAENSELRQSLIRWEEYASALNDQYSGELSALQATIDELTSANHVLAEVSRARPDAPRIEPGETFDPRVRTTVYCLIALMAREKYHFRSEDQKSSAPGNLSRALGDNQIEMAEKTIRNHLKTAAEIFEQERQKALSKRK